MPSRNSDEPELEISFADLQRWRQYCGLKMNDDRYDDLIRQEYKHALAARRYMSVGRIWKILRGPKPEV